MAQQEEPRTGSTAGKAEGRGLASVIEQMGQQLAELRRASLEREQVILEMTEREAALALAREDVERREQRASAAEQELASRAGALESLRAELAQRGQHLDREVEAVEAGRKRLEEGLAIAESERAAREIQFAERERRLSEMQSEIASRRAKLDEAAARLAERERAAEQAMARAEQAEQERARLAGHAADLERSLAEVRKASEQAAAQAEQDLAQARSSLAEMERRARELEARSEAAEREAKAEEERMASSVEALAAQLAEATAAMNSERAGLDAKRTEAAESARRLEAQAARIAEMTREAEAREARIAELSARVESLAAEAESGDESSGVSAEEVSRLTQELEGAASRLRSQAARIEALEEQLAAGGEPSEDTDELHAAIERLERENARLAARSAGGRVVPEEVGRAVAQRWSRLRVLRRLIREQQEKVTQAGEALRQRYEQCEQVLSQREALARARADLAEGQKKLERLQARAARGRASALVFYLSGTALALAALSWGVAGALVVPPYAARAVLSADAGGATATEAQLAEWQAFQEAQFTDPATIELIAERMGRRGIASLSTPGQVQERMKRDLVHESPQPGRISVELRGEGEGPTTRVLDTIVTALASQANATKERRADGLGTVLAEPVNTKTGPISDRRPLYAAATFLVSFGLANLVGAVVWRRMSAAKVRLDEAENVDRALEETLKQADAWKANRAA
ncbi:MAG: hypothetical protein JNM80_04980 [Phycisphaerae bacterium]|nr:hypothetical protein [Phycisphaerae bacterium]